MEVTRVAPTSRRAGRAAEQSRGRSRAGTFDLGPPSWVSALFAQESVGEPAAAAGPITVSVADSAAFTLVTAREPNAAALDAADFERCANDAYRAIAEAMRARPHRHPVRFWNHIPDIRRMSEDGLDRYMTFNAGRFAACSQWFGGPQAFDRLLPTASAVGHDRTDLVVHALAADDPGVAVENPRQVPSYKYSKRFGPRPPCFARATVLPGGAGAGGGGLILVAGTASIRGEQTVHPGDVRAQTLETFENLSVLVEAAAAAGTGATPRSTRPDLRPYGLRRFRDLRVYYVRERDRATVKDMVSAAFGHRTKAEYVRADLCRPDLLVEIEGTAIS